LGYGVDGLAVFLFGLVCRELAMNAESLMQFILDRSNKKVMDAFLEAFLDSYSEQSVTGSWKCENGRWDKTHIYEGYSPVDMRVAFEKGLDAAVAARNTLPSAPKDQAWPWPLPLGVKL
jgi:hypothetical protein